jgi:hypothetical protein
MRSADYDFAVYRMGICHASACTSLPIEHIEAKMNAEYPTGIQSSWVISEEGFQGGEENPCECKDYPDTHKHYLFEC